MEFGVMGGTYGVIRQGDKQRANNVVDGGGHVVAQPKHEQIEHV